MLIKATIVLLGLLTAAVTVSYGQSVDSMANTVLNYPTRLLGKIQNKNADLDRQLTKQTERYLQKLADREARLKKKIARIDSTAASRLFSPSVQQQYAALEAGMRNDTSAATGNIHGQYLAGLDSMKVGLSFLQQNPQLLGTAGQAQLRQLQVSLAGLQQLQTKMANTSEVQDFIRQRKAAIRDYLSHLVHPPSGLAKEYQGFNQDLYYYDQQVEQYKQLLNDPDKLEKKALSMLDQFPAFQQFMRNNSQLAGFTKNSDLPFFLREIAGIEYVHEPLLAPTDELLDEYRKNKGSWDEYERSFQALMEERKIESTFSPEFFSGPSVLLCSEPTAEHCHRRLVAEYLQRAWGDVEIRHL